MRFVANGVPIDLAAGEAKSVARRQELEIKLSLSSLAQVAQADRVVGMLCGGRFELNSNAINIMRELLLRVREELALTGEIPRPEGKPVGESL